MLPAWVSSVLGKPIYEDDTGARALASNPNSHARTKHIDIRYHFTRDKVSDGSVAIVAKRTSDMLADLGTKLLARVKHQFFSYAMGSRGRGIEGVRETEGAEGDEVEEARRE